MATGYDNNAEKKSMSPILIAIAVIALVGVIGWVSYANFMPRREIITLQDPPNVTWMKQKALESQGDINRLNPADRQKLEQIAGSYAATNMRRYFEEQKAQGLTSPRRVNQ